MQSERSSAVRRHVRAGLGFPVGRTEKQLRRDCVGNEMRLGAAAIVGVAAAAETVLTEIIDQITYVKEHSSNKKELSKRITPKDIASVIRHDTDLSSVINPAGIAMGGQEERSIDELKEMFAPEKTETEAVAPRRRKKKTTKAKKAATRSRSRSRSRSLSRSPSRSSSSSRSRSPARKGGRLSRAARRKARS